MNVLVSFEAVEKAEFRTPLRVQLLDERPNSRKAWRLLSPLVFASFENQCKITVDTGFDTDFASVPRTPFTAQFIGLADKAAVIHDALYEFRLFPRTVADKMFLEAMTVDRISGRHAMYAAVVAFGEPRYNPDFVGWPD